MKIYCLTMNPFQVNCYIYWDENTHDGLLIDPGAYTQQEENEILRFISDENINIKFIINTHGHIDHILGNAFAKKQFDVPLMIHNEDEFLVLNSKYQSDLFGLSINQPPKFDYFIEESGTTRIGDTEITFLHTPGHSPGGVCIVDKSNRIVITGDVLFRDSIGRTDLQGGDYETLRFSITEKLFKECTDDYTVYPGHFGTTTIGYEKSNNPFLK